MHDQDNIFKKYNILCVIVTVKRLLLGFYICKEMCGIDSKLSFLCGLSQLYLLGKYKDCSNIFGLFFIVNINLFSP